MKTKVKHPEPVSRTIQSKSKAANQAPINQILQRYKAQTIQRQDMDEDELLQGKFEDTTQRMESDEDEEIPIQAVNRTGLPDNLKVGVENLSGYSMDDVRVHYNSGKPAQLQALAYTQGTDIHVAPGQEKHLPHEAWHVVQQKQGRVQPTMQLQGININDNEGLEKEADTMGEKSIQRVKDDRIKTFSFNKNFLNKSPIQMKPDELAYGYYTKSGKKKSGRVMNMERFGNLNRIHNIEPDKMRERLDGDDESLGVDKKVGIWRPSKEEGTARPEDPPLYQPVRTAYHKAHSIYTSLEFSNELTQDKLSQCLNVLKEAAKLIKELSIMYKSRIRNFKDKESIEYIQKQYKEHLDRIKYVLIRLTTKMFEEYKKESGNEIEIDTFENIKGKDGEKIWREKWQATIQQVNYILDISWKGIKPIIIKWIISKRKEGLKYMREDMLGDLDYIGSLAKGYKSAPKQYLHFLPESFDVDANLDAPSLAVYAINQGSSVDRGSVKSNKIEPLKNFENIVWAQLILIPGIDTSDPFEVFIHAENVTDIMRVSDDVKNAQQTVAFSCRLQEIQNRIWWLKIEDPNIVEILNKNEKFSNYIMTDQTNLKTHTAEITDPSKEYCYKEYDLTYIEYFLKELKRKMKTEKLKEEEKWLSYEPIGDDKEKEEMTKVKEKLKEKLKNREKKEEAKKEREEEREKADVKEGEWDDMKEGEWDDMKELFNDSTDDKSEQEKIMLTADYKLNKLENLVKNL